MLIFLFCFDCYIHDFTSQLENEIGYQFTDICASTIQNSQSSFFNAPLSANIMRGFKNRDGIRKNRNVCVDVYRRNVPSQYACRVCLLK